MDVDTDREKGVQDKEDDDDEDKFTKDRGAVLLVNSDDDDDDDTLDNADTEIQGQGDPDDVPPLVVHKLEVPTMPADCRLILRIKKVDAARLRIFDGRTEGSDEILGPTQGTTEGDFKYHIFDAADVVDKGELELGIEGLRYPYRTSATDLFDGHLEISLILQKEKVGVWTDVMGAKDTVALQVTPVVFSSTASDPEKLYLSYKAAAHPLWDSCYDALRRALPAPLRTNIKNVLDPRTSEPYRYRTPRRGYDLWCQDMFEIGNTRVAAAVRMPVMWDMPRRTSDSDVAPEDLRKDDKTLGYVKVAALDYEGGNIEVTPPCQNHPLGRVVMGTKGLDAKLKGFVDQQKVQGPAVTVGTDWLAVGHVDEIFCFVKRGEKSFVVLVPSPMKAIRILQDMIKAGEGSKEMWVDYEIVPRFPRKRSVEKVLTNEKVAQFQHTTLQKRIGPDETTIHIGQDRRFEVGNVLTIEDERVKITGGAGTTVLTVDRHVDGTAPASHKKDELIYHEEDLIYWNRKVEDKIGEAVAQLRREVAFTAVGIPVLFTQDQYPPDWTRVTDALAYTPNLVNALVLGDKTFTIILPNAHGPVRTGQTLDEFQREAQKALRGIASPQWVEGYFFHVLKGGVHCATQTLRAPSDKMWWEAWR